MTGTRGAWIAMVALVAAGMAVPGAAHANSKEQVFEACRVQMEKEFGQAEFDFQSIRRSENRNFAFGEMTLEDGSKRPIRCRYQRGAVRDVRFRSDSEELGDRWSSERPDGAVYVPLDDETEDPKGATTGETGETTEAADGTAASASPSADADAPETAETAEATGDAAQQDAPDGTAEPALVKPRFMKAPRN